MSDQSREQYIATFARRVLRFRVLGVVAAVVSVVALAYLSLFTVTGQWLDTLIMYSFQAHIPFQDVARTVLHTLASIPALLLFALILIVTVLLRKRFAIDTCSKSTEVASELPFASTPPALCMSPPSPPPAHAETENPSAATAPRTRPREYLTIR